MMILFWYEQNYDRKKKLPPLTVAKILWTSLVEEDSMTFFNQIKSSHQFGKLSLVVCKKMKYKS